jgi:Fe-S-cluster containining protein
MREVAAIAAAHPKKLLAQRKKLEEQVDLFGSMVVKVFGPGTYPAIDSKEAAEEFSKQNEELADLWWAAQVSCVFLRDDNTCSVYDARPISCRGYFVRTDPARCFELQKTEVEAYNFNAIQFLRLRLMEQSEGSYTLMYLPTALLMALKNM